MFVHLVGTLHLVFRGVQFHGGSAPRAKRDGVVIPASAYRVVFVAYPKAIVYLALGLYVLCASRVAPAKVSAPHSNVTFITEMHAREIPRVQSIGAISR